MKEVITIYVKALSNGEWFGGWAPVRGAVEWLREDGRVGLFSLLEPGLDEDDEYEFYQPGALLIAVREGEDFQVRGGVEGAVVPSE